MKKLFHLFLISLVLTLISSNCPPNTKLENNECIIVEGKCKGGKMVNGKCLCPSNKFLENDKCINGINKCKGSSLVSGRYLCPKGQILIDGTKCICPPGYVYRNGKCLMYRRKF